MIKVTKEINKNVMKSYGSFEEKNGNPAREDLIIVLVLLFSTILSVGLQVLVTPKYVIGIFIQYLSSFTAGFGLVTVGLFFVKIFTWIGMRFFVMDWHNFHDDTRNAFILNSALTASMGALTFCFSIIGI